MQKNEITVRITKVNGSAPRNVGTSMSVGEFSASGTIGGGQLEFQAIQLAREMLAGQQNSKTSVFQLGPDTGQCCGGTVELEFETRTQARRTGKSRKEVAPRVLVFGAGHVGLALANAFCLAQTKIKVIDSRIEYLELMPDSIETELLAAPEAAVRSAAPNSAYIVLTHDHALDFLVVEEALKRQDASYVGMIGSKTKRAVLEQQMRKKSIETSSLICPIGALGLGDKRPEIIAASVVPEVLFAVRGSQ